MIKWLRSIRSFVWQRCTLLLFSRCCAQDEQIEIPKGLEWSWVVNENDPAFWLLSRATGLEEKFTKRLCAGDCCLLAKKGGLPVHFSWVSEKSIELPEIAFCSPLSPRTAYLYHSYTFPAFRGQKIYSAILKLVCRHVGKKGFTRLLVVTHRENQSARSSIARAGFSEVSRVGGLKILGNWRYHPADWFPGEFGEETRKEN